MTADLSARISEGSLDRHRVAIAAALGCEPAIATGVEPDVLDDHYRTRIEHIAACLTQRECIVFGYECALRALTVWEKVFPTDLRPRRAVEAVRVWLSGKDDAVDFDALSSGAGQSGIEVDYPELTEDVDPELCAAMEAANACSHAALAVHCALGDEERLEIPEVIAWVARFAVKSASDPKAETDLQARSLAAMLLE